MYVAEKISTSENPNVIIIVALWHICCEFTFIAMLSLLLVAISNFNKTKQVKHKKKISFQD